MMLRVCGAKRCKDDRKYSSLFDLKILLKNSPQEAVSWAALYLRKVEDVMKLYFWTLKKK